MKKLIVSLLAVFSMICSSCFFPSIISFAEDDPLPKSGVVTLSGDANDLQDQTITFKFLQDSIISPSKILKTNFTNSDDYTWSIAKAEDSATTVTLSKNGTESTAFHDLTKNDAIKITCDGDGSEILLFSATGSDFGREFNIYVQEETIPPSLGDDETVTLKVGEEKTIADLSQIFDDDGNSYVLHEYNYQVGDHDSNIAGIEKLTANGFLAKDDDYITALKVKGRNVGQTVVEVTLCNNDRVPIELIDSIPPHITKKYTINVVGPTFKINPDTYTFTKSDDTLQLENELTNFRALEEPWYIDYVFKSSDDKVATVDEKGLVAPVENGQAVITAMVVIKNHNDPNLIEYVTELTDTCNIRVDIFAEDNTNPNYAEADDDQTGLSDSSGVTDGIDEKQSSNFPKTGDDSLVISAVAFVLIVCSVLIMVSSEKRRIKVAD